MNKKESKLFVFSAPSGSGKTTIVRNVLKQFPEFIFSVSATTRKKRRIEVNGKDYFFISEKEFLKKIDANEFVEWEKFYGYYYGTLKDFVDGHIKKRNTLVFELDVKGALNFKVAYPDAVLIFISPPNLDELKKRLKERKTETEEDYKKRTERAEMEMTYKDKFDYVVINRDLDSAKKEVEMIIKKEIN
ncbi:MAG: guanylate kinase [Ignavibacteria bacterium RBG_13_36_8]|nr:MAG: guanylate kinase [Ignavibacteria bacterium RBG_13_36_8]